MTELFLQMDIARDRTLQLLEAITEEAADVLLPGYNNTLRWHLGHIATVHENLCLRRTGETFELPDNYPALFANGTKPAEWNETPPSLATLRTLLAEQPARLKDKLASRLDGRLPEPFRGLETVAGIVGFSIAHEGIHTGYMMSMRRGIAALKG